jgi:hypothetical protein
LTIANRIRQSPIQFKIICGVGRPTIGPHTLGTLEARKAKRKARDIPKCDKRLASDHPVYKDFVRHTAEFFLHT